MSEQTAPDADPDQALSAMEMTLLAQAIALDRLFYRAAIDALSSDGPRALRDTRTALKAQHLCRTAFKVLLALRAAGEHAKKSRNRTTDYWRSKISLTSKHLRNRAQA